MYPVVKGGASKLCRMCGDPLQHGVTGEGELVSGCVALELTQMINAQDLPIQVPSSPGVQHGLQLDQFVQIGWFVDRIVLDDVRYLISVAV